MAAQPGPAAWAAAMAQSATASGTDRRQWRAAGPGKGMRDSRAHGPKNLMTDSLHQVLNHVRCQRRTGLLACPTELPRGCTRRSLPRRYMLAPEQRSLTVAAPIDATPIRAATVRERSSEQLMPRDATPTAPTRLRAGRR